MFSALVCVSLLSSRQVSAKVFPEEDAKLNYRIIGFSFASIPAGCTCKLQIACGHISDARFFKPTVISSPSRCNHIIAEVPAFGANYTWRVIYRQKNKKVRESRLYHFSTGTVPTIDTAKTRLRVTRPYTLRNKWYIVLDGSGVMYDMNGRPVWYLPPANGLMLSGSDIKCTPQHTLTLLADQKAVEINYHGKVLWNAPGYANNKNKHGQRINYHHEFTRLANGHYLAMGTEILMTRTDAVDRKKNDTAGAGQPGAQRFFQKYAVNSQLYEFDTAGNLVWTWKSGEYYKASDVDSFSSAALMQWNAPGIAEHANSFYFDEKEQVVYLSYSTLNRIIKISYPSGKVVETYGVVYAPGNSGLPALAGNTPENVMRRYVFNNGIFCGQHCVRKMRDGALAVYNNNLCDKVSVPEVLLLQEPAPDNPPMLKKQWAYTYAADSTGLARLKSGGGSINELADGSLLVSMNPPYCTVFVVNRQKEILWSALPERKGQNKDWEPFVSYRASMLSEADLEQLIWNSEGVSAPEENE